MSMKYAYSLYGDRFTGAFDSAEDAFIAAVARANALPEPPTSVFVGRIIPPTSTPTATPAASSATWWTR